MLCGVLPKIRRRLSKISWLDAFQMLEYDCAHFSAQNHFLFRDFSSICTSYFAFSSSEMSASIWYNFQGMYKYINVHCILNNAGFEHLNICNISCLLFLLFPVKLEWELQSCCTSSQWLGKSHASKDHWQRYEIPLDGNNQWKLHRTESILCLELCYLFCVPMGQISEWPVLCLALTSFTWNHHWALKLTE